MSWITMLAQTYDNCKDKVGISDDAGITLLPIAHSTQIAQIEVIIDMKGGFRAANRIAKDDGETIIPVTEDSANRSSGIAAHPLHDKLIYVAGDYSEYIDDSKKKYDEYYNAYIEGLGNWANSKFTNVKIKALYEYLSQGTLISDLVEKEILVLNESGKLDSKEKINGISEADTFVRFRVEDIGNAFDESALWKRQDLYDVYQQYYQSTFTGENICYATGELKYCSDKHSGKIRHSGDKSKIISANDSSGFTYRGRFVNKEEANAVSYEVSQKAHNALKWIIQKENIRFDEMVMIAFRVKDAAMLDIVGKDNENLGFFDDLDDEITDDGNDKKVAGDEGELYAKGLKKAIWTGNCDLDDDDDIIIMTLEAATTGRLSITYYKEMSGSKYKRCIEKWNRECRWYNYSFRDKKIKDWTLSLESIVRCAYGVEQGNFVTVKDKLKKMTISRLVPCVIDAKNIPLDIVERTVINASRANCFSQKNWNRILRSACAVVHKYYSEKGDEYDMVLEDCKERDYLYGRLLAIADIIERDPLPKEIKYERCTNAQRYMVAFQKRPYRTWLQIRKSIQPYLNKIKGYRREEFLNEIDRITDCMSIEEFSRNDSLNGKYLLGFSNQKRAGVYHKEDKKDE